MARSGVDTTVFPYPEGLHRQQHQQHVPQRSKTLASTQGSCDMLAFPTGIAHTRFAPQNSMHYKSEPALAAYNGVDTDEDDDNDDLNEALISTGNEVNSEDYLNDAALGSRRRRISATPPTQSQQLQSPETYAVSFPIPQASYV